MNKILVKHIVLYRVFLYDESEKVRNEQNITGKCLKN